MSSPSTPSKTPISHKSSKRRWFIIIPIIAIAITVVAYLSIIYYSNYVIHEFSISFYVVGSGSMVPTFNIGDLLIVKRVGNLTAAQATEFNSLKVGEPILFKNPVFYNQKGQLLTIVHRIAQIYTDSQGQRIVKTKGDTNPASIEGLDYPLYQKYYIGKVIYDVPKAGFLGKALAPPVNYILMAAIAIMFVTVYKVKGTTSNKQSSIEHKDNS